MRVTITNLSPLPRRHWVVVTLPEDLGPDIVLVTGDRRTFWGTRGAVWDHNKVVYRIRVTMSGNETLRGDILDQAASSPVDTYKEHAFVRDDPKELMPHLRYLDPGAAVEHKADQVVVAPYVLDFSPAHRRWTGAWRSSQGVIFHWWADVLHDDPVIPVWGKIVWSDRNDPRWFRTFRHFVIQTGEMIAFDFAVRNGFRLPHQVGAAWTHMIPGDLTLQDGMAIPLSGSMLCMPSGAEAPAPDDPGWQGTLDAMRDLTAASEGPIVAVCDEWDGHFGGRRMIPGIPAGSYLSTAAADWRQFKEDMAVKASHQEHALFGPRRLGCSGRPANSGEQEDFGSCKGMHAVTDLDPTWIRRAQHSVQAELFRGTHHYEIDGHPLRVEAHPKWVTWAGRTHFNINVSPDRLGKDGPPPWPSSGWHGYDDEHRSQNNLAAYLQLTDDPLMQQHLVHVAITDSAATAIRFPQYARGPARAQGRVLGCLHMLAKVGGTARSSLLATADMWWRDIQQAPSLQVDGPMKVLAWGRPDRRKAIFHEVEGIWTLAPWASMWEHGVALVGLAQAGKVNSDVARIVARTLATFGYRARGQDYETVNDILWSDGEAPPGWPACDPRHVVVESGWWGKASLGWSPMSTTMWTRAGLVVASEILRGDPLRVPLEAYLNKTMPVAPLSLDDLSRDRMWAEWSLLAGR